AGLTARELVYFIEWPEVEATVLSARLVEEPSGGTDSRPLYRPEIAVRYTIDGKPRAGRAVATYWSNDRSTAEQSLARHSPGARETMRYDPSNPEDLRFDAELDLATFKVPLLSGAAGVACLLAWLALRKRT